MKALHAAVVALLALCFIGVRAAVSQFRGDASLDGLQRKASPSPVREARSAQGNAECGVRGQVYNTLIAGGEDATFGEFPWHVGVYRFVVNKPHVQDCGGTLVSRKIVITAAHCFWDDAVRRLKPLTLYKIAAGKYFRAWDQHEQETQTRDIAHIGVPKRYRGHRSNFQYDIAVVTLTAGVDWTETVKPICVDWTSRREDTQLAPGVRGTVVGWGVTLNDTASDVLQKIDLPYVDFDTCFEALPLDAQRLYSDDKFCAGFANKSRSVCRGDSGGGLVFADSRERYYLRGVVSVSFKPAANRDPCYSQLYTGFTLVSTYLPWIKTYVDAEESSSGSATPEPPKKKSKSEEMCQEYASAVYESVDLPSSAPIRVSTCAMSPRGITGQRLLSQRREFPHMAALGYKTGDSNSFVSFRCNGNLISELFVLTAAHCVVGLPGRTVLSFVRLGSVNLKDNTTGLEIMVNQQFVHPDYKPSIVYHDVALLQLKEAVSFNGYMRPACLDPNPSLLNQDVVTAASWGRTSQVSSAFYDNLMHGDLRIADSGQCRQKWVHVTGAERIIPIGVTPENILCVDPIDVTTDCALTSGSPLMVKLSEPFCMYRIVGFLNFGERLQCDLERERLPSIAMRVSAYVDWIERIVWPDDDEDDSWGVLEIRGLLSQDADDGAAAASTSAKPPPPRRQGPRRTSGSAPGSIVFPH